MATPKLFSLSVLAASALVISAPAMAKPVMIDAQTEVHHADLDLSTAKGQKRLKIRVQQAVKQVCRIPRAFSLEDRMDQNNCEANAIAQAMPKAEQTIAAYLEKRRFASKDNEAMVGN